MFVVEFDVPRSFGEGAGLHLEPALKFPTYEENTMSIPHTTPKQIVEQLHNWQLCFWIWNVLHYVLGLVATVGAVFIAQDNARFGVLNLLVPVSAAALTFLNAKEKANVYIAAWRFLNSERIKYELMEDYDETRLAESHAKAEELIGSVN